MPLLSPHLDFDTPLPPAGSHLVVSDTLTAPAGIVLLHLLSAARAASVPVIWLDIRGETQQSLVAALRRTGSQPPELTTISPSFLPPPLAPAPHLFSSAGEPDLRPTYDALVSAVSTCSSSPLLILDGLSELVRSGHSPASVARFVRAVRSIHAVNSVAPSTVSLLHADHLPKTPAAPDAASADGDLLPRLLRLADTWWRVSGLATGRSGDVSGEISVHALRAETREGVSRAAPLQFRLEVGGVKVFAKGTGRGFL